MATDNLKNFVPRKKFLIGIDSDGTVYDSMELKHKECFCPAFINNFDLQAVAKYAREVWEFVNLYSRSRGCNRFQAVVSALDLLRERPEVHLAHVEIPKLEGVRKWISHAKRLGNPDLEKAFQEAQGPEKEDLQRAYRWSKDVNAAVRSIVRNVAPFPYFREALKKMSEHADILVVSQTPTETLEKEWKEFGIDVYVRLIAGQEMGSKTDHLQYAGLGKYSPRCMLMIGDAPGDLQAAKEVGALFYPIVPGRELNSWKRFLEEGLDCFLEFRFEGEYQDRLIEEFYAALPEVPPWQREKCGHRVVTNT